MCLAVRRDSRANDSFARMIQPWTAPSLNSSSLALPEPKHEEVPACPQMTFTEHLGRWKES